MAWFALHSVLMLSLAFVVGLGVGWLIWARQWTPVDGPEAASPPPVETAPLLPGDGLARAQGAQAATICQIQGAGAKSAMDGRLVRVEGVVTGAFGGTDIDGFFIQAPGCDADPAPGAGASATRCWLWPSCGPSGAPGGASRRSAPRRRRGRRAATAADAVSYTHLTLPTNREV